MSYFQRGLVTREQLVMAASQCAGRRIDCVLVETGLVNEEDALKALADALGLKFVDLSSVEIDRELLGKFPTSAVFRHTILPLGRDNGKVRVATHDPFNLEALNELSALSGFRLDPVLARRDDVLQRIKEYLGVGGDTINELIARNVEEGVEIVGETSDDGSELTKIAQSASVIRLVNELLVKALELMASDVHIEPQEKGLTVRFRCDGMLRVQPVPPEINQFYAAIVTRLKIMSRLNIAEKRLPQDGRIKIKVSGREIDVRVSIIPMLYGEGVVLRLLDKERMKFDLRTVGMPPEVLNRFHDLISLPHGIVLVTGPTGSGKTTTLYAALNAIKDPTIKIITVKDPVEYHSNGISQIQVHSKIGLTFAAGLRSILRHDPDVILIGEIRDGETAKKHPGVADGAHGVQHAAHQRRIRRLYAVGRHGGRALSRRQYDRRGAGPAAHPVVMPEVQRGLRPQGRRDSGRFSGTDSEAALPCGRLPGLPRYRLCRSFRPL